MTTLNIEAMSTKQLVDWYNQNVGADKMVKKFKDRRTAERRCADLAVHLMSSTAKAPKAETPKAEPAAPEEAAPAEAGTRPVMKESLKLDRTIRCVTTEQTWKNAYRMWVEHPDWMTSSQQDRLTAQLYRAAKQGEKLQVEINGRVFELVNVEGK